MSPHYPASPGHRSTFLKNLPSERMWPHTACSSTEFSPFNWNTVHRPTLALHLYINTSGHAPPPPPPLPHSVFPFHTISFSSLPLFTLFFPTLSCLLHLTPIFFLFCALFFLSSPSFYICRVCSPAQ